jgi:hypothetical protein
MKKLLAGQECSIKASWVNVTIPGGMSVIITTNNLNFINYLYQSPEFKPFLYFYHVTDYIGPPGTEPNHLENLEN